MHTSVRSVFKKKNPRRVVGVTDVMFYHSDVGLLIEKPVHGLVAWAETDDSGSRCEVRFDETVGEFVFVDTFQKNHLASARRNKTRNPWYAIKIHLWRALRVRLLRTA